MIDHRICVSPLTSCAALLLAFTLAAPAFGQRDLKDIPPADPELERQALQVADGFEINLWAADPLLAKPIQMNFDAQGRLWVASSEVYPQIMPGQTANDKILILEDTKGAGHADKTTVFADGLLIPTAVIPGDGGAYVANSTELLHLSSSKHNDHADTRRVVLSGFGTEDTHHILHTFTWGPEGLLYFNQSVYIHSHIETPYGVRRLNAGGCWRFQPETMRLEVFTRGCVNGWGHAFDRWGQSFMTDGAGGEGIIYAFPGVSLMWANEAPRVLDGLNPGSPKFCSLALLSGRHLPDDWQGNAITNDFRAHRVCRFVLTEHGSGYLSKEMPELVKTNHPAFRPIDVKMGPDGAIYIADWYNPIIQHGEVDFRDPRRDHTHGRIWRVTAKNRPLVELPKLVDATDEQLLDALKAPEDYTRQHAKQLLKERGDRVLPALAKWVEKLPENDTEREHQRLEALWVYQALRHVEPTLLKSLLRSDDPHVRAAATRVLSYWQAELPEALELLSKQIADDHPRVRLEAVRALAQIPSVAAAEMATRALDKPMDVNLDFALWQTARDLQSVWLPAVQSGSATFDNNPVHLTFALQAVGTKDALAPLMALLKEGRAPSERLDGIMQLVATMGGPAELGVVFNSAMGDNQPPARRLSLIAGLAKTAEERNIVPSADLARVGKLLGAAEPETQALGARAAGLWHVEALRPDLNKLAESSDAAEPTRGAAMEALARLGGDASRKTLEKLCGGDGPFAVRAHAAVALAMLDLSAGAAKAADVLASAPTGSDPQPLFKAFLARKDGATELATAISKVKLPADCAKLGIRAVRASTATVPTLVDAINAAGGLTNTGPRMPQGAALEQMMADVKQHGNPERGENIFRRAELSCTKCHAIGGVGGSVGPDLVSIGASAPVDYLIESILVPSAKIKEGYHAVVATTNRGRIYTGVKVRQTDKDLILRDAEDHEIAIPLDTLDTQEISNTSLMPVGLADELTRDELVDLVRFLSELGKVGPYSLSKAPTARRWQTLVGAGDLQYGSSPQAAERRIAGDDPDLAWAPAYTKVAGELPVDALPKHWDPDKSAHSYIRCRLEAISAGSTKLKWNSTDGLRVWVDGKPLDMASQAPLDLTGGMHTLLVEISQAARKDPVRLELVDVPGSTGRFQFVGGK